ncbi:MAG: glycosyltransferase [Candidatus Peribacter sp.]|jgi:glycosyltransferase involved in cell wall biosynthesis|nr:glycosyltransferase [Candidatus Peribacter sp.]MBT4393283.1 glycosyltransferase [Candidatus Peribacter sp.]MBT4601178.1 glycosyltransferase [Candidatus Peribacter sp.]MBT5148862.1 glycosyltransferase [Candidatus Peribacter sp.]MBT5637258.1 glycosyltransferase [Candidatus Peribacter sp.]
MPKVSVLVPTYKPKELHLSESLESLRGQTETDWECIICDEPTDTDTHALILDYMVDERFKFYKNEKCLGIGGNWNRCFQKSSGQVIACLFQDDLWEPDYLETALKIFSEHQDVGLISMHHKYQYDDDLWTKEGYELVKEVQKELMPGAQPGSEILEWWLKRNMHPNIIGEPPFVVLRRELMEKVGPFNENMPQFLDVEYWLRCLQHTNWYYEKKSHGAFRVHGDAASAKNNESGEGLYDRLTVFEQLIKALHGPLKKVAIKSRNRSVQDMIEKFLNRVKHGKGTSKKGSGQVVHFVLRHPIVVGVGFVKALAKKLR